MRLHKSLSLLGLLAASHMACAAKANDKFQWPQNYKAAVSLAYDDALDSQLDFAIPTLDQYHVNGTFYLKLSSPVIANRLPEWRAAAARGHELANHTLFHQCSKTQPGRDWVLPEDDLDKISVAQIKQQVLLANTMLYAIDGKHERTFTAPCLDPAAGGENYITAIKSEFVAVKLLGGSGVTPNMKKLDPYAVSVFFPTGTTGQQLIDIVKQGAKEGTMVNFTFHGVNGDHLSVTKEAHEELVKYLAENKDIYWTDTFLNIMKYVKEEQKRIATKK